MSTLPKSERWFINHQFVLLWLGQSISNIGDFFFTTTLALWVATQIARGQSWAPLAVSGVALANVIPVLLVGPIAGVFVDRWNKRQTMLRMDALRAILVALLLLIILLLPFISSTQDAHIDIWYLISIYTIEILVSVCSQFFNPSRMTFIGDIVPDSLRARAVSLTSISFNLALIVGPSLAAPLYFALRVQWAIAINALSFVVSFLAILLIRVPQRSTSNKVRQGKNFLHEFSEGLHVFRSNNVLVVLLLAGMLFQLGAGPSDALYILFAIQNLHTPRNLLGFFEANYGIGVILGLLLMAFFARRIGEVHVFWLSFLLFGSCMVIFSRLTAFVPGFILFFLLGFANAGIIVVVGPLMLRVTPREFMGRVQSVNTPLITGSALVSTAFAGWLASTLLHNFHITLLGSTFGPIDTIFSVSGLIVMSAGVYVLLALHSNNSVTLPKTEIAQNV